MPLRPDAAYKLLFSTPEIVRDLVTRGHTRRAIASLSPLRAITPA